MTPPIRRLSALGQLYVTTVGAVALLSVVAESAAWYVALVVLALPLSLLALWVASTAAWRSASSIGPDAGELSWPVALVWVSVWTDDRLAQRAGGCRRCCASGWRAVAGPPARGRRSRTEQA